MGCCKSCFFYGEGYLWNGCSYFTMEYFTQPIECAAFSEDGNLTAEQEKKIYEETDGAFGKSKEMTT